MYATDDVSNGSITGRPRWWGDAGCTRAFSFVAVGVFSG